MAFGRVSAWPPKDRRAIPSEPPRLLRPLRLPSEAFGSKSHARLMAYGHAKDTNVGYAFASCALNSRPERNRSSGRFSQHHVKRLRL